MTALTLALTKTQSHIALAQDLARSARTTADHIAASSVLADLSRVNKVLSGARSTAAARAQITDIVSTSTLPWTDEMVTEILQTEILPILS